MHVCWSGLEPLRRAAHGSNRRFLAVLSVATGGLLLLRRPLHGLSGQCELQLSLNEIPHEIHSCSSNGLQHALIGVRFRRIFERVCE